MTADPSAQPDGLIRLHVRPPTLGSGRHVPWVQVDGVRVPVGIGDNLLEVPAGPHVVRAAPRWDPARVRELQVDVGPGTVVPVFYADPASRFTGGSLGTRRRQDWALRCLQLWGVLMILGLLAAVVRT
ncbi:hypothetical protein F4692_003280 [Nocardioides cavernae]|uniref:Uncharacterized protein n=1 Tax=Nocardioides cavernae TaxID=1921566 RepID=A0A7Y9H590_9ACTN|nr:hypothetical protein [Nocardioides cavernae]NYE38135.1 hypothetical protein [Nocardioides cavernae]